MKRQQWQYGRKGETMVEVVVSILLISRVVLSFSVMFSAANKMNRTAEEMDKVFEADRKQAETAVRGTDGQVHIQFDDGLLNGGACGVTVIDAGQLKAYRAKE